jgi:hypothetical protein
VNGQWLSAAAAEEIVRPRRLIRRFWRPLNFTVRRRKAVRCASRKARRRKL